MATSRADLQPGSALPVGSTFPQFDITTIGRPALRFDDATEEKADWNFKAPQGLSTPVSIIIEWATSSTAGNVGWDVALEAVSTGDSLNMSTAESFDTDNATGAVAVPTSPWLPIYTTLTLTNNDSIAAGDRVRVRMNRDTSVATNSSGDLYYLGAEIRDSA